jgi:hypothetical protein
VEVAVIVKDERETLDERKVDVELEIWLATTILIITALDLLIGINVAFLNPGTNPQN